MEIEVEIEALEAGVVIVAEAEAEVEIEEIEEIEVIHHITRSHLQQIFLTKPIGVSIRRIKFFNMYIFAVKDNDRVAIKIRGMPYSTRYEEIAEFFKEYQFIEKSALLGTDKQGRKNGFGAILLDNPEQAKEAAQELNQTYIRDRYVDTSVITYGDYLFFNGP